MVNLSGLVNHYQSFTKSFLELFNSFNILIISYEYFVEISLIEIESMLLNDGYKTNKDISCHTTFG